MTIIIGGNFETLRPDLGGSVMDFDLAADREGFVGLQAMRVFEAMEAVGQFGIVPLEAILKAPETSRTNQGHYPRGTTKLNKGTFSTEDHGHERAIDDRSARMYRNFLRYEQMLAQACQDVVLRELEQRIADLIFDTAAWNGTAAVVKWDVPGSALPITDVDAAANRMFLATGLYPNAMILNRQVFKNVRNVDQIVDRVKFVEKGLPTDIQASHLSRAFDIPNILVAGGAKNAANEGQAASIGHMWGSTLAAVLRIATTDNIEEPCVGRTIHWSGDGSTIGATIEEYRDPAARANIVRARMDTDLVKLTPLTVELITSVT